MCNCLEEIKKDICKDSSVNYVDIDCSTITNFNKKESGYKTGQRININYRYFLKNGDSRVKNKKSFITHTFCPFCGIKY